MSVTFEKSAPGDTEDAAPAAPVEQQPAAQAAAEHDQEHQGQDDGAPQEQAAGLRDRLPSREEVGQRARAGVGRIWSWVKTEEINELDLMVQVAERQKADRERAELELRHQVDRLQHRIVEAEAQAAREAGGNGQTGGVGAARRASSALRSELAHAEARLRRAVEQGQGEALPPSARDVKRARLAKQTLRGCIVVGAVVGGGIMLPIHTPLITPVVLLAAAVALWKLGARGTEDGPDGAEGAPGPAGVASSTVPAQPGLPERGVVDAGQAQQQAPEDAVPQGQPVQLETLVQAEAAPAAVTEVEQASRDWLMDRLVEAGVVTAESSKRAKIVSMLTQGPGWTATVQLPPGKKAKDAIARSGEIASALTRKASQIEMAVDTSEDGHEGRFTMWVSDHANPYGGPPVPSLLIDAERWDLWRDGVPLGADARGVRKVLYLLWSSLMVGGLQRYGKTFFVRLIAAAAALDPNLKIVLLSAKPSADWLPLRKIAYRYVVGKSPDKVREIYETLVEVNTDLDAVGHRLEKLAEQDLRAVPEGKLTRALSGHGLQPDAGDLRRAAELPARRPDDPLRHPPQRPQLRHADA
ncbi:hypothetical protein GXW82_44485 [Streptacidiphilus sp. 4-A2]|nr:hypothetical protein [Streptacidiphilus sp. 4-A2]